MSRDFFAFGRTLTTDKRNSSSLSEVLMSHRVDPKTAACPKCGSKRGILCHEQGHPLRNHFHRERVTEAEHLAAMTRNEALNATQFADMLMRVRDELDAADKLPAHSRRQLREEILARARAEYGPAFDDEALPAIESADEDWREPNQGDVDALKQLARVGTPRMSGAA